MFLSLRALPSPSTIQLLTNDFATCSTKAIYSLLHRYKPVATKTTAPVTTSDVMQWLTTGPYHDKRALSISLSLYLSITG